MNEASFRSCFAARMYHRIENPTSKSQIVWTIDMSSISIHQLWVLMIHGVRKGVFAFSQQPHNSMC